MHEHKYGEDDKMKPGECFGASIRGHVPGVESG